MVGMQVLVKNVDLKFAELAAKSYMLFLINFLITK